MPSLSGWYCDASCSPPRPGGARVSMPSLSGWYCDATRKTPSSQRAKPSFYALVVGLVLRPGRARVLHLMHLLVSMPSLSGWYCDPHGGTFEIPECTVFL